MEREKEWGKVYRVRRERERERDREKVSEKRGRSSIEWNSN